ncbi:MAG TPA: ABC transporter ATP-binding protein [Rhodothermales bacterium]|nr:ABC transporter ATP-binding protein [Rhodothermales bacterium]
MKKPRQRIIHLTRQAGYTWAIIRQTLGMVWQATGWWSIVWVGILVVQGAIPAGVVYVTKWIVDAVALLVQGAGDVSWEAATPLLFPVGLMGVLVLGQQIIGSLQSWLRTYQSEKVQDHVKALIHEKAASVDYEFYESDLYHDQLEQANSQASAPLGLLESIGTLIRSGITVLSFGLILISYTWWLPVVLVISTLPALLVVVRHNRRRHEWWKKVTPLRRVIRYYDLMLTLPRPAAEIRAYSTSSFFRNGYQTLRERLRNDTLRLQQQQTIATLGASVLALLVVAGTMGWILWRAMRGAATLGDLALFYQVFNQGQSLTKAVFTTIGQIYTNTLFLEHLFSFLTQENKLKDPISPVSFPARIQKGVQFDDVSFTYPGNQYPALEHFNLFIPAEKVVAVVGENGAGKSTFVKLLCRFYDPSGGKVMIDDIDLRSFTQEALRRQISVMFQFPVNYQLSVKENILFGDLDGDHSQQDLEQAAKAAGAHEVITRLEHGYDTRLGRLFENGAELSGGEWQRIALARAFLRQAQLLILDEPTSFMDSWAELDWMKRFKQLVRGRTALIITHRFTTAMQADFIYVMEEGRVVESGTHSELLEINGRYALSWKEQMQGGKTVTQET